jgi:hypothetical protein
LELEAILDLKNSLKASSGGNESQPDLISKASDDSISIQTPFFLTLTHTSMFRIIGFALGGAKA